VIRLDQFINVEFTSYVALAVLMFAVRQAVNISNRMIPLLSIVLGFLFAWAESKHIDFKTLLDGIQYALYATGSVAAFHYIKSDDKKDELAPDDVIDVDNSDN
jgi:beta-xylosidase